MQMTIERVVQFFDLQMPPCLAEDWDNTGLLIGDQNGLVTSIMTCLTVTPTVVDEAVRRSVSMIVSHHPLPFRPIKTITDSSYYGGMIWRLASAGISLFSPHTRFDSAAEGINQQLAEMLKLNSIEPLEVCKDRFSENPKLEGRGRFGACAEGTTLQVLIDRLKSGLNVEHLKLIPAGEILGVESVVRSLAIGCGSAGEFVRDAAAKSCDLFVTGEATFHGCLEAQSLGVAMILTGHYASERFAVETLAERLSMQFPDTKVWASHAEKSPLKFV